MISSLDIFLTSLGSIVNKNYHQSLVRIKLQKSAMMEIFWILKRYIPFSSFAKKTLCDISQTLGEYQQMNDQSWTLGVRLKHVRSIENDFDSA